MTADFIFEPGRPDSSFRVRVLRHMGRKLDRELHLAPLMAIFRRVDLKRSVDYSVLYSDINLVGVRRHNEVYIKMNGGPHYFIQTGEIAELLQELNARIDACTPQQPTPTPRQQQQQHQQHGEDVAPPPPPPGSQGAPAARGAGGTHTWAVKHWLSKIELTLEDKIKLLFLVKTIKQPTVFCKGPPPPAF